VTQSKVRCRWLITGGAGFIGSHLADRLIDCGDAVLVIDDLSTGSVRNIANLREHDRFKLVVGSVTDRPLVAELVDGADRVVHLAAVVGVRNVVESPVHTIELNVHGTETVLGAAARKGRPVLVASTSEVYGKSDARAFVEDQDLVLGPPSKGRWSYAASKLVDECLALAYFREKRLPTTVVRLFNTVGPRQTGRYGMVIPTFVGRALREEPIDVYGTGTQSRCFCHVADTVQALHQLGAHGAAIGQVVNVGSREEVTILALAERVLAATRSRSAIRRVSYDAAYGEGFEDMMRRVPDTDKIEQLTGWKPERTLDDILADIVAFERSRL
jgi:UDP-glucose 4-epimerase